MEAAPTAAPLAGWTVLSLRPAADAARLRRLCRRDGARLVCVAPWRIEPLPVGDALAEALRAPALVATSPNAVRAAQRLVDLANWQGHAFAVGRGTADALRRAGIREVAAPERMDSEGLLALPALRQARELVLLTGEGGRNLIAPALRAGGARVQRIDLYRRQPRTTSNADRRRVAAITAPAAVLLSSAEALRLVAADDALLAALRRMLPVHASERLRDAARELGLGDGVLAASAQAADLLAALRRHAKPAPFR